jgi:hypothetical protein
VRKLITGTINPALASAKPGSKRIDPLTGTAKTRPSRGKAENKRINPGKL